MYLDTAMNMRKLDFLLSMQPVIVYNSEAVSFLFPVKPPSMVSLYLSDLLHLSTPLHLSGFLRPPPCICT